MTKKIPLSKLKKVPRPLMWDEFPGCCGFQVYSGFPADRRGKQPGKWNYKTNRYESPHEEVQFVPEIDAGQDGYRDPWYPEEENTKFGACDLIALTKAQYRIWKTWVNKEGFKPCMNDWVRNPGRDHGFVMLFYRVRPDRATEPFND